MKNFTWIQVNTEGDGPIPVSDHAAAAVYHPKHLGSTFGLFKWPDKLKKISVPMIYEGIYFFGGLDENGYSTNDLWVL